MLLMLAILPFHYWSKKLLAPTAEERLARDGRPPVLYLRSFAADSDEVGSRVMRAMLGQAPDHSSAEESLAAVLEHLGPVVAIGRPGERLPTLGAARVYVSDDEWQERVAELASRASLVVLRLGETEGFWWEVSHAARTLEPSRVLIFVPGATRAEREGAYQKFRERAASLVPDELPPMLGRARYIWFGEGWTPVLLEERWPGLWRRLAMLASAGPSAPALDPIFRARGVRPPGTRGSVVGWLLIAVVLGIPVLVLALIALGFLVQGVELLIS